MKYFLLLCAAALGLSGLSLAQTAPPPLEAYGRLPLSSSAELSPDGTKIAAIANLKGTTRLIIFEVGGEILSQVGLDSIKARDVSFFDNEHVILTVSETTRTRGFRGEYEYSASFAINLQTQKSTQLLRGTKNLFPAQSGLGRIVGRGKRDGDVLMPAFMGSGYTKPSRDLLRVSLKSGRGHSLKHGNHARLIGSLTVRATLSSAKSTIMTATVTGLSIWSAINGLEYSWG